MLSCVKYSIVLISYIVIVLNPLFVFNIKT